MGSSSYTISAQPQSGASSRAMAASLVPLLFPQMAGNWLRTARKTAPFAFGKWALEGYLASSRRGVAFGGRRSLQLVAEIRPPGGASPCNSSPTGASSASRWCGKAVMSFNLAWISFSTMLPRRSPTGLMPARCS
eukprot:s5587_g3.t1